MSPTDSQSNEQQRRLVLERIQSSKAPVVVGSGVLENDRILLGRFFDPNNFARLRASLAKAGIESTTTTKKPEISVFVAIDKRNEAFEILAEHKKQFPDVRPKRFGRAYDLLILMCLVGIGGGGVAGSYLSPIFGVAVFISAICIGYVLTHLVQNCKWHGRLKFSMVDLLLFTGIAAVVFAVWAFAINWMNTP